MKYKWILVLIAVLVLVVVPVSAGTASYNAAYAACFPYATTGGYTWDFGHDRATGGTISTAYVKNAIVANTTSNSPSNWSTFYRGMVTINSTDLPDDATVTAATLSYKTSSSSAISDQFGGELEYVSFTPANSRAAAPTDFVYTKWGTTALATATDITGLLSNTQYTINLNAAGLSNVNITGDTVIGFRMSYDVDDIEPPWTSAYTDRVQMTSTLTDWWLNVTYTQPEPPVAAFSCTPLTGLAPVSVTCTDASTNSPSSWNWTFGDGSTTNNTIQSPIHTYANGGTFTVNMTASNAYGSDDESKTAYVNLDSSAMIRTYPITSINNTWILPNSDTNLPSTGSSISINATQDMFKASSFVIKPNTGVSEIAITGEALSDGAGHTIPANATDIKIVGVWYQVTNKTQYTTGDTAYTDNIYCLESEGCTPRLVPELLLNNKSILRVDLTSQTNEIYGCNATWCGYTHVDNTTFNKTTDLDITVLSNDTKIYDNATVLGFPVNFSLTTNENQQIWLTTHVPSSQAIGNYTGNITIVSNLTAPVNVTLNIRVLPFPLRPASKMYLVYTPGGVAATDPEYNIHAGTGLATTNIDNMQQVQYAANVINIKNHGSNAFYLYDPWYNTTIDATGNANFVKMIDLINAGGFTNNRLITRYGGIRAFTDSMSDPSYYGDLAIQVTEAKAYLVSQGYTDYWVKGYDEGLNAVLATEEIPFGIVLANGANTWVTGMYNGSTRSVYTYNTNISVLALGYKFNETEAALWHAQGKQIWIYGNPQSGLEYFEIYRKNYGLALWNSSYNGTACFNYMKGYGNNSWNDFDSPLQTTVRYKDHMFVYPTSDGAINTIQYEGWREGIDDARMADTLEYYTNHTFTNTTVYNGLASNVDMSVIRATLIDQILANGGGITTPVTNFTCTPLTGVSLNGVPVSVTCTDSSTGTPTSWAWYNNTTALNTTQNATFTLGTGAHDIKLNASNSAGYNWSNKTGYITITATNTPVASFTKSRVITRIPQPITFTDTSSNTPTSWLWSFSDQSADVTTQSPTHSFARPGLFTITLTSTNAAGSSTATDRIWAVSRLYGAPLTPYRVSVSCTDATYSTSRELTAQELLKTEELIMNLCNPMEET